MPAYAKFENWPGDLSGANGLPYAGGSLTFVAAGTSTPAAVYSDDTGTALSDGVTVGVVNLNLRGVPETAGGTACEIYGNTEVTYDMTLKDSLGATVDTYEKLRPLLGEGDTLLTDAGSANSYVVAPTPAVTSYGAGDRYSFLAANTNTGASVIQVSGLGSQDLVYRDGSALDAGVIVAGQHIEVVYDGTNFVLISPVLLDEDTLVSDSDSVPASQQSVKAYVDDVKAYVDERFLGVDVNTQAGTTYTLVLSDGGKMVTMNNASANTLTIPANASVAFAVGTEIHVMQLGAGQTTIAITTDTLNFPATLTANLREQYAVVTIKKITSTSWVLFGLLEEA